MNTLVLAVDEEQAGSRIDKFLATVLVENFSRERLQVLIKSGQVTVDEVIVTKPSSLLNEGAVVTVLIPDLQPIALAAENIPLDVLYEDTDLLVVNKPAGMLTHPTPRELHGTLVNALLAHCEGRLSGINGQIRPGIVHRLDRDTEGLLMVAKTDQAHRHLSEQLKIKTARREYVAIVQGVMSGTSGTVNKPIGRDAKHRDKMAIVPSGRPAVTHWEQLDVIQDKFSLLKLKLETGRTHQIRVHMASIGHPLLNDPLYGTGLGKTMKLPEKMGVSGQLLQAVALGFTHPVTEEAVRFEIAISPAIRSVWETLGGTPINIH